MQTAWLGRATSSVVDAVRARRGVAPANVAPDEIAAARTGTPLVVSLLGMLGFAGLVGLVRRKRSEAADLAISMRVQAIHLPWLQRLMAAVSWPGFPPQSRIIPPALIGTQWLLRFRLEAIMQLVAWGAAGLSTLVKSFMRRPRPVAGTDLQVVAADLGGSSFPSGHVLSYVGTYGWLAIAASTLIQPVRPRRIIVAALAGLITLVGPSRIYQGHHWATDVAASYLLGFSYLAVMVTVYRQLKARRSLS